MKVKEKIKKYYEENQVAVDNVLSFVTIAAAVAGVMNLSYMCGEIQMRNQIRMGLDRFLKERVLLLGDPDSHVIFELDEMDSWEEVLKRKGLIDC